MPCPADEVAVGVAQTLRRAADGCDAAFVELDRVKAAGFLKFHRQAHVVADLLGALFQPRLHIRDDVELGRTEVNREDDLTRNDVPAVRIDVDMPGGAHRVRRVGQRNLIDQFQHTRHAQPRVPAHRHGGGACVGVAPLNRQLHPGKALAVGDDADLNVFSLKDRTLFDVQFKEGMHLAVADRLIPTPADALQFVAEFLPLRILAIISPLFVMDARENARGQHRGGVAGAFFVRPIGDHDGMFGLNVKVVEGADQLEPT